MNDSGNSSPGGEVSYLAKTSAASLSTLLAPAFIAYSILSKKLRNKLQERLSFGAWSEIKPAPSIWIHAASLGELQGVIPLLPEIKKRFAHRIFVTTTSIPGLEKATALSDVAAAQILPIDHPLALRRALNIIQPELFLNFETEIWPNLLTALHERKVPAYLINGRISDRSFPRYRLLRNLLKPFLNTFSWCFVQSQRDRERFIELGAAPEKITVSGSTKYDQPEEDLTERAFALKEGLFIPDDALLFVCGSVRPGESEILLKAFSQIKTDFPSLRILLVPRHKERFEIEAELVKSFGFRLSRRSSPTEGAEVFMLDSTGELKAAYFASQIAFVGGTLVPIGGHNPLEAAQFAKPILVGPHFSNVSDAVSDLLSSNGAFLVKNADEVASILRTLLGDPVKLREAGESAQIAAAKHRGAVEKIINGLPASLV